jgi:hypothetical protein
MLNAKPIVAAVILFTLLVLHAPGAQAQVEKFDGRPDFSKGSELGYFIWHEGDTWKVRWTTTGAQRNFTGAVTAEGGELRSLKRIDLDTEREIIRPGRTPRVAIGPRGRVYARRGSPPVVVTREQDHVKKEGDHRIVFNARTRDDIDGFDFKVDERVTALRFNLEINGKANANRVEVGRENQHPPSVPFTVNLR